MLRYLLLGAAALGLIACSDSMTLGDGGLPDGSGDSSVGSDASTPDGALPDSGLPDSAAPDSAAPDSAAPDSAAPDSAAPDAAAPDSAVPVPDASPTDGGACSVEGDFSISIEGMTLYFRFGADGSWAASTILADLAMPDIRGTYSSDGSMFRIKDAASEAGCGTEDEGLYTLTFDASCGAFSLALVTDACAGRSMTLDGVMMTRLP